MAVKLNELEETGTRWKAPSEDYPQGSFINGTGQGKRDGSYAKAEWANDLFGAHAAILKNGGETPNGQVETANNSQVYNALKKIIKNDIDTLGGDPSAVASGTVNAITATFTKPVALDGGKLVKVRAIGANTSPTVTFNPNGLGAKPVVKGNDAPLAVGDIAGEGYWLTMIYDATLQKWVLQNPATGVTLVLPEASESTKGIVQIASSADVVNGKEKLKAVTPFDLMQNFVSFVYQSLTTEQKAQVVKNLEGTFLPLTGGVLTGDIEFPKGRIKSNSDSSRDEIIFGGNTSSGVSGSFLSCRTTNSKTAGGSFVLVTKTANGSDGPSLFGTNDGGLRWNNLPVEVLTQRLGYLFTNGGADVFRYESGLQVVSGTVSIPPNSTSRITLNLPYRTEGYSIATTPLTELADVFISYFNITTTGFDLAFQSRAGLKNFTCICKFTCVGFWK